MKLSYVYVCMYVDDIRPTYVLRIHSLGGNTSSSRIFLPARKLGTCYGNVSGWLGVWVAGCHTPVLYQNG